MSYVFRLSKVTLVASVALTVSLVVFGNIADYGTNWTFVTHVLSMGTIFPGSSIRHPAIAAPDQPVQRHMAPRKPLEGLVKSGKSRCSQPNAVREISDNPGSLLLFCNHDPMPQLLPSLVTIL